MWKLLIPLLLVVACDKTTSTIPVVSGEQYSSTNHVVGDTERVFVFRLDEQCNAIRSLDTNDRADSAYQEATKWRAWSEVGELEEKKYYPLTIKKGSHGWEPSCDHPWNTDSIGNVKSVVVWN